VCAYSTGDKLYLPVATSIPNLIKMTVDALEAEHAPKTLEEVGIQVPGLMWVSVQFCPKNPLSTRALNYTGKLKLVHKVQQRTLRAASIDSHYVAAAYKYMRSYGLWLHNLLEDFNSDLCVISASCDDMCEVNVGEPSLPIQLAQRGKASIVPWGFDLVAGDHDFHVCNLTPSVTLLTNIKAHPDGDGRLPSLYKGNIILINAINNINMTI
jgi:hypothetical protein